ncbi:MAG: eukaryotic-like serine/threonine-protein kinase [Acidobacteriota bacterium]|nr:eukaryotic-like serine/threonine-protein kinase [Acidobacteriota bacterium]
MIGKTISHYRILGQVGEGGMGVVYVAEDVLLGRRVAIKIPHAGKDENHYRSRFLREARSVSKLRHRNIAAVHDCGETEDGQPFIVMELISGQTLGEVLAGPGLSISRAVEVTREVAEALSEAHRRGVVHRDIKPSNIIIDEHGEVKVLDFGLAKQLHEEFAVGSGPDAQTLLSARTRSDVVIGTPLYLSPEQARGSKVDGRSDLFALGALLYECLTGRPAFSGANVIEIGAQVLHFDPPPPSRLNPRVPSELDRLTLKALAKRAEDRFQTADEFASELKRVRLRLPDTDTTRTRRLITTENGHRSSALITMAEGLRRPKFSPLTLAASLAALLLLIWAVAYWRRPSVIEPPPDVVAIYRSGADAMRDGAYYKASGLFREALSKEDRFALAHARLAEAWMEMDFLDRAKDEILAATTLVPDFQILPREDALYLDAVRSTLRQDYANAIKDYQEIVTLNPDQPQAHLDLGRAFEKNNDAQKAIGSYTAATVRDPSYAAAFLRLGILHARQGNQAGAADAFDRAQTLYAAHSPEGEAAVHYQRGRLLVQLKKRSEARPELEQALTIASASNNRYQQVLALQQLAYLDDDKEQARSRALSAVKLAQASGMNDLVAYGYITLGNVLFLQGDYEEAERNYQQALELARNYKVRRYEAMALSQLGSLRANQSKPDEAEQYSEKALEFYRQGGYRREADQVAMVLARSKRLKGDYAGALQIFEEMLRHAEQSGDQAQVGSLHRECGAVLFAQEKYAQALEHLHDSVAIAHSLHNSQLLIYSLINQADTLWRMGRFDEAEKILGEVTGTDSQTLGMSKDLMASVLRIEADMSLSRRRFPDATAKAKQALALLDVKKASKDLLSEINIDLGLSESFGGSHGRGRALCEEAARLTDESSDPWTVSNAQAALAEALLEDGNAVGARAAALRAQEIFVRTGRADSEWRALVIAGKASRRAGDETAARGYLERAATSVTQLEQSLGADASVYLSRPDIQRLRSELGGQITSAAAR